MSLITTLIILTLGIALLCAIDLAFVAWAYELEDRPQRIDVVTADGWTVTAWHRAAEARPGASREKRVPVVLCHGLANNHSFMEFRGDQNLAKFLSSVGFDCYSLDLRGAGDTRAPDEGPWDATVDDHVRFDLPALVDEISRRSGSPKVVWIGHSLGGVVALAAASTTLKDRIAALITIGSPVYFSFPRRLTWLMRLACALAPWGQFNATVLKLIAPFAGRTPAPAIANATANLKNIEPIAQRYLVANVFAPMWKGVLTQLEGWVLHDRFASTDATTDYRAGVATLRMPILVIGGTMDHLAPPAATTRFFELVQSPVRELALLQDYGHGDLVIGARAHLEVYPLVEKFLRGVTPSPAPVGEGWGEGQSRS
ncbi:MAG: alpha/beta hydrolase [Archangium sp.]|nr:alpha/beta hydrolase [Archangium sp.]